MNTIETPFVNFITNKETGTLSMFWKPSSAEMSDDEFKVAITTAVEAAEKHELTNIYVDAREYFHTLVTHLQEWHDSVIVPKYIAIGITKIGFVMPEDFFTQISIEQTFEEDAASASLQTKYFDSEAAAKSWLSPALV